MYSSVGADVNLFLMLNGDLGSFMDSFMWCASSKLTTIPLGVIAFWLTYKKYGLKQLLIMILSVALIILIADQTCQFFKHFTPRPRPTHQPLLEGLVHTVNGYNGGFAGTVSAHAANTFGVMVFCALIVKKMWYWVLALLLCITVCFSRIYLGVHYPFDIAYGTVLGLTSAFLLHYIFKISIQKLDAKK